MKICMVGLGSIGIRHLRNLTSILNARSISFSVDALRATQKELPGETSALLKKEYTRMRDLPEDYDVAFICNPTALHYETILEMAKKAKHLFIEKPLFDHIDYDLSALNPKDGVYYVACPLRYTRVMQYLKAWVSEHRVYSARAICSTYLPDWRPGVDYKKTYSADRKLGGGVSIDLIHEWDYLTYLFGAPQSVLNAKGTYSELGLKSDDLSLYIGSYPDKLVSLHLDYFGRAERREIELYTRDDTIIGDLRKQEIRWLKSGERLALAEERDDYQRREIEAFLDMIEGKAENHNPPAVAYKTLSIALGDVTH
jgi:predicted dehydrogenase